jgi:hypothetical protein
LSIFPERDTSIDISLSGKRENFIMHLTMGAARPNDLADGQIERIIRIYRIKYIWLYPFNPGNLRARLLCNSLIAPLFRAGFSPISLICFGLKPENQFFI